MNNFLRITAGVDVMPLLLALRRRPDVWHLDTYLRDYPQGPFGDTESVILRFPAKGVFATEVEVAEHQSKFDQHENIDQPIYQQVPEARLIVMNLMAFAKGERLGRVMINKLRPGGKVFAHADTPVHAEYYTRFHVCLQSSPGYVFRCGDEQVYMAAGEVWWFNNRIEHEVLNNSADERISMVIDIRTSR